MFIFVSFPHVSSLFGSDMVEEQEIGKQLLKFEK
jgi:hypothetical protein